MTALRLLAKAERMGVSFACGDDLAIVGRNRDLTRHEQRWLHQNRGSIWLELHVRDFVTAVLAEAKAPA